MSQRRNRLNEAGFTLIELLIVLGILTFILVQLFAVLNFNYTTVGKEVEKKEMRENLRVFSSFFLQDVMTSEDLVIFHGNGYDAVTYEDRDGKTRSVEFNHTEGIYLLDNGDRLLIATGARLDDSQRMVYESQGFIVTNFFSRSVNAAMDTKVQRRVNP